MKPEGGRYLKEECIDRRCYCTLELVEAELHYVIGCLVYRDIQVNYIKILNVGYLSNLFEEQRITKISDYLIKIHNRRSRLQKEREIK